MSVASVHASPAINHNVGAESTDHADHVFEDLVAPDTFRFLRGFRIAKIFGSCKVKPHAVSPCCCQQFLRPDQSQLRRLFGAKVVLPALAACQREQRDIRAQPACKIRQHRTALIVRMGRHVQNPRRNPSALDRLDRFRQTRSRPRGLRKLCQHGSPRQRGHATSDQDKHRQTSKIAIHATSTARQVRIITVNPQPETADFQTAIVSLPARELETPAPPTRSPPVPISASPRSARTAKPTRPSLTQPGVDTTTS